MVCYLISSHAMHTYVPCWENMGRKIPTVGQKTSTSLTGAHLHQIAGLVVNYGTSNTIVLEIPYFITKSVKWHDWMKHEVTWQESSIFILDFTPDFNGLGKDNCKMRWEIFKFGDLVHFILEVLQYSCFGGDFFPQPVSFIWHQVCRQILMPAL